MIEGLAGSVLLGYLSPVALFTAAICLLVLRAGASRVFFDIVGTFQATKMIKDAQSASTVFESLYLDTLSGIQESAMELSEIFNGLTDAVVPIAREIAEAEIQLDKFLETGLDVKDVREDLEGIGMEFGFAGDQAMEAAAKMAQISGVLGAGSLTTGTEIGMRFGLISGMETEAAMQRMINLEQQTKFMTDGINENASAEERANAIRRKSMLILDQLNTIENRSAATMEQITFVMNQFASQAHLANEEIRSMAALSAVMIETGEEQGKGGRALRMMYARLGSNIGGAKDEMERLGVAVTDAEGNMRPLSVMLKELEKDFKAQTGADQQLTAQIIAGNRHYTRFLKLMSNLDRVRELELESAMRLFPAMDEIERRRQHELFQLEQSEAAIRNYSAALGEALLPAMTDVNLIQANFLKTMAELAESPIFGKAIVGVMGLAKGLSTIGGPVINTIITFKSLSISLQTQLAVMRALNQQQNQVSTSMKMNTNITDEQILKYTILTQRKKDLEQQTKILKVLDKDTLITQEALNLNAQEEIQKLEEHNRKLSKNAGLRAIHSAKIEENRQAISKLIPVMEYQNEIAEKQTIENLRKQSAAFNSFTMQTMGAGMALMAFGKNQNMMRAGMILNTAAIGAQIVQMIVKNAESLKSTITTEVETGVVVKNTIATQGNTLAIIKNNAAKAASTAKSVLFSAAMAKNLAMMGAMGVAAVGLSLVIDKLTRSKKKAKEEADALTDSMISATDVLEVMASEDFSVSSAQAIVDKQQGIIDNINIMTEGGKKLSAIDKERLEDATRLRDLNQMAIDETEDMIDLQRVLAMDKEDLEFFAAADENALKGQASRILMYGGTVDAQLASQIKRYDEIKIALGDYHEEFMRVFRETGDVEEATKTLQGYFDVLQESLESTRAQEMIDDTVVALVDGVQALDDFNNAREELFFGSRSNMTGDLIRQVQQQGVENLVATTEVVMTNVFNGLTIPQMADIVIDEIESRGFGLGYNITTS